MMEQEVFADISVQKDLKEYLEAVAKELDTEVPTLLASLVFDGLAYNLLRNLVEERGITLDEVVLKFLSTTENGNEDDAFEVDTDNDES